MTPPPRPPGAPAAADFVRALGPDTRSGEQGADLARRLLDRWSEPHRRYHTVPHLVATLEALHVLVAAGDPTLDADRVADVELAVWFHDAVYAGRPGQDEEDSAALAETELLAVGLPPRRVGEVARLVRLTAGHRPAPDDVAGRLLCDADLSVLGAPEPAYRAYARAVRAEYRHVSPADFRTGRAAVLAALSEAPTLFRTSAGRRLWEARARANLAAELARLSDPETPVDGDEALTPGAAGSPD